MEHGYPHILVQCWSTNHVLYLAVVTPLCGIYLLALPYLLFKLSSQVVVFRRESLHEQHLQAREIEYLLGINTLYSEDHYFLVASYRRQFAYWKTIKCFHKFLCVACVVFLSTTVVGTDYKELQATALFATIVIPTLLKLFFTQ